MGQRYVIFDVWLLFMCLSVVIHGYGLILFLSPSNVVRVALSGLGVLRNSLYPTKEGLIVSVRLALRCQGMLF